MSLDRSTVRRDCVVFAAVLLALTTAALAQGGEGETNRKGADPAAVARWRQMRFGMFIHWGPVTLKGTGISWSRGYQVPIEEYDNLYKRFNPVKFNGRQWAKAAKEAGMKYVVLTTKHHDGFACSTRSKPTTTSCTRPSGATRPRNWPRRAGKKGFDLARIIRPATGIIPTSPWAAERAKASGKPHPNLDRYEQYLRKQVAELIANYGPLVTVWFDMPQLFDAKRGQGVIDFVRSLQPDILINNRLEWDPPGEAGDYDTPEGIIGKMQIDRPWETCMTICTDWSWRPNDIMKSLPECLQTLVRVVCRDGNLLLNVGPTSDGQIEPRQVDACERWGSGWPNTARASTEPAAGRSSARNRSSGAIGAAQRTRTTSSISIFSIGRSAP